jgi:hypothetical protein
MADVIDPSSIVPPHKKTLPTSIPVLDSLEGFPIEGNDDYQTYKKLQAQLEYVEISRDASWRRG